MSTGNVKLLAKANAYSVTSASHMMLNIIKSCAFNVYLVSPSEEAGCVDVRVGVIFIVRHLNVVPNAVVYPGHYAT